jgi:hypothetical protein
MACRAWGSGRQRATPAPSRPQFSPLRLPGSDFVKISTIPSARQQPRFVPVAAVRCGSSHAGKSAGRPSWRQNFRREPGGRGQLALLRHDGLGFQSRSSNASRRETLTGSSPVCMLFRKNDGKAVLAPLGEGFLRAYQSIHGTLYRSDSVGRASSNVRLDIGVPGFEAPREGAFVWQSPAPEQLGEK